MVTRQAQRRHEPNPSTMPIACAFAEEGYPSILARLRPRTHSPGTTAGQFHSLHDLDHGRTQLLLNSTQALGDNLLEVSMGRVLR